MHFFCNCVSVCVNMDPYSEQDGNVYYKWVPPKPTNMDDILIVSLKCSEASSLWVEYFSSYFQQVNKKANRKGFKIQELGVEEIIENKDLKPLTDKTSGVKLQLIVIDPSLLEFISQHAEESQKLGSILLPDRTLALLLGVKDSDLTEEHLKVLPTYFQWQRKAVGQDQDENFTKDFLSQAMAILSKVWKQQSSALAQENSFFSVTPKKIRQGQSSVFVILTYPLQKEDIVKVSVEKNGEIYEITSTKRRNPYLIKMSLPDHLTEETAIVNILVEKNGSIIGRRPIKCESKLRELEQILRMSNNPIEFMCQTLGFAPADREHLDNWMIQAFQRNLPPHFNLLANHTTPFSAAVQVHKRSNEEYPTLLHFAAKFGLEKLTMQLLDCPGADIAQEIRNVHDLTPVEIAESNGHLELCCMLKGYISMTEFTSVYTKLKEGMKNMEIDEEGYLSPKVVEGFYQHPPTAARPVETPPTITIEDESTSSEYIKMDPLSNSPSPKGVLNQNHHPHEPPQLNKKETEPIKPPQIPKTLDIVEDKVQKELAEIILDFKNNVHSIAQVEKLVEEWKNRNDVQKSFKEKQEQLKEMRLKYEKIQHDMKMSLKKPSALEKIVRIFSKQRNKDEKLDVSSPISESLSPPSLSAQRPISALSTSSSGSSGRMSTLSGCSLGDSGTHSDNEERKHMLIGNHNDDDLKNEFYKMVPAPKPVKMFPPKHTFETIEENTIRPNNNTDGYIHFPPSGLPVPGLIEENESNDETSREYMNLRIEENLETHDYMNYKSPNVR
ncbi:phosphoinositide 3-kinase adapter protein 1 isoform X2 [Aethina tumida]|uniref:phosphoinositide 3-kinase adapter protein 1 isoform X2 n=1 Tax=Aethina tumida TaxID=116153 RepID=UPI00214924D9|nr:phosphoinositide 3-kinase adapter protein 1 isoform X2 [Aethina tumida]